MRKVLVQCCPPRALRLVDCLLGAVSWRRLLGLEPSAQAQVFNFYQAVLEATIEAAKKDGKYDDGIVDVSGSSVRLAEEPRTVLTVRRISARCHDPACVTPLPHAACYHGGLDVDVSDINTPGVHGLCCDQASWVRRIRGLAQRRYCTTLRLTAASRGAARTACWRAAAPRCRCRRQPFLLFLVLLSAFSYQRQLVKFEMLSCYPTDPLWQARQDAPAILDGEAGEAGASSPTAEENCSGFYRCDCRIRKDSACGTISASLHCSCTLMPCV